MTPSRLHTLYELGATITDLAGWYESITVATALSSNSPDGRLAEAEYEAASAALALSKQHLAAHEVLIGASTVRRFR